MCKLSHLALAGTLFVTLLCLWVPCARAQATHDAAPTSSTPPAETIPLQQLVIYPAVAQRSGLEGDVSLEALVGKDGIVKKVKILSGYAIFERAATDAVLREKFRPATCNGEPCDTWTIEVIHFRLNGLHRLYHRVEVPESLGLPNFASIIGLPLEKARLFFQLIGNESEMKAQTGMHFHAYSLPTGRTRGFSIVADGSMIDSSLDTVTLLYTASTQDEFVARAERWGLLSTEPVRKKYPNGDLGLSMDSKSRTFRVELYAK